MEIEEMKLTKFIFAMRGLRNKGLIQISEDAKTGDFVVMVGKEIKTSYGKGKVVTVNPLKRTVSVNIGEGNIKEVSVDSIKEGKK